MMTHAEMNEFYELYALGALETELAVQIDAHIADRCEYCLEQVRSAVNVTAALSGLADSVEPPAAVRQRLLATITPAKPARSRFNWWVPALAAACLALFVITVASRQQLNSTQSRLERVLGDRDQLRSAIELLSRSDTRTVQFGKSDEAAHGRVLVNRKGGFVVVGSQLPSIAQNKTFELWLVPVKGAPQPAGLFRANANGEFVHIHREAFDPSQIAAVAVSVEPEGGSSAPTTKPFLIVPLG